MFKSKHMLILASCVLPLAALAAESARAPNIDASYGLTVVGAVEVCDPSGEREYLSRLICPTGHHPTFERGGSFGTRNPSDNLSEAELDKMLEANMSGRELQPGETDYHVVDGYDVTCPDSKATIYLDMYHCSGPRPSVPPQGFTIVD
jgi:hypothetical protein